MQKYGMWKPETDNQTLPPRMLPMEGQQKKNNMQSDTKSLLGNDCEINKIIYNFFTHLKKNY